MDDDHSYQRYVSNFNINTMADCQQLLVTLSCLSSNQTMAASILPILKAIAVYLESIDSCSARALSNVATQASNSLMAVPSASHLL